MEIALWTIAIVAILFLALRLLTAWLFRYSATAERTGGATRADAAAAKVFDS
jgi:hypothetical protein